MVLFSSGLRILAAVEFVICHDGFHQNKKVLSRFFWLLAFHNAVDSVNQKIP